MSISWIDEKLMYNPSMWINNDLIKNGKYIKRG